MKIHVIQIGKTKESFWQEACGEYAKRLGGLKITTLKEVSPSKTVTIEKCLKEEGRSIISSIADGHFVVVLDEKGRQMDSKEFGKFFEDKRDEGRAICFVIGGAFGLCDAVRQRADMVLSMSKMTFTHQMIRPFLLEQIYRGLSIADGKEYHNE